MTAYARVARELRDQILAGQWRPGEQLPTERLLCGRFQTSRITIRRALEILEREQVLSRRQGAGTFVSPPSQRRVPLFYTDFTGSIARHAPDLERRLLSLRWVEVSLADAQPMGLPPGDAVLEAVRQDVMRGEPVSVDRVCLPRRFAQRMKESDFLPFDFMAHWKRVERIEVARSLQTIEADRAEAPVTRQLDVRRGTPVLREVNRIVLSDDRGTGLIVSHYRHDCFRFEATSSPPVAPTRPAA